MRAALVLREGTLGRKHGGVAPVLGGGRQRKLPTSTISAPRKHMAPIDRTGSCKCGKIKFQVKGDPIFNGYCHCRVCSRCANSSPVRARRREAE